MYDAENCSRRADPQRECDDDDCAEAGGAAYPQLLLWRDADVFEQLAGYFNWSATIGGRGEAEQLLGVRTSASLFPTLGIEPFVGRLFTEAEESRGAEPVAKRVRRSRPTPTSRGAASR